MSESFVRVGRRGRAALRAWPLLGLVLVAASSCEGGDRYECGVKVGENVSQCDEPNQVCVCGERRCAKFDADCAESYRFVFGDEACISKKDAQNTRLADPSKPENSLCPEEYARPELADSCGEFDEITRAIKTCAGTDEKCVCTSGGGICAKPANAGCPKSGFAANAACLSLSDTDFVYVVEAGSQCGEPPRAPACGVLDDSGRAVECEEGFVCACAGASARCARKVDEAVCASGLLYEVGTFKQCVSTGATTPERGLCKAEPVPAVECGVVRPDGRVEHCLPGETCACSFVGGVATGSCVQASSPDGQRPCSTGYELVSDHSCLALSDVSATVLLAADQSRCPLEPPAETSCGAEPAKECVGAAALGCLCSETESLCVVTEPGCDSGVAFAGSKRCAAEVDRNMIQKTKACAGLGGEGGGGSGAGGAAGRAAQAGEGGAP